MSRATIVYISMFVLLGAGLWAVLAFGARVRAPQDVSGYWQVRPAGSEAPFVGDGLDLEQSGKYLRVRTSGGYTADLKLVGSDEQQAVPPTIRFAGDGVELTLQTVPRSHRARIAVTGPFDVAFDARRVEYQGRTLAKEAPAAATGPATQPLSASRTDEIDASEW